MNSTFGLKWRRAPAHTALRYILKGLDPVAVEAVFRRHAALLQAARAAPGQGSIALDGKTLRGSFGYFHDRATAQVLSAYSTTTATRSGVEQALSLMGGVAKGCIRDRGWKGNGGEDCSRIRTNPSGDARLRSFAFSILKAPPHRHAQPGTVTAPPSADWKTCSNG